MNGFCRRATRIAASGAVAAADSSSGKSDRAAVEKLYAERHEKYESAADFTVDNADATPDAVAQKIAEIFCS